MGEVPLYLPKPRGYRPVPCPMCRGKGAVALATPPGPRACPTCRGGGQYAETWLTEGDGLVQRARQLGLGEHATYRKPLKKWARLLRRLKA